MSNDQINHIIQLDVELGITEQDTERVTDVQIMVIVDLVEISHAGATI